MASHPSHLVETKKASNSAPHDGELNFNLLSWAPLRALFRWRGFPGVFQVLALGWFVVLATIGWGHYTPEGVNAKLYAKTNLVNLTIWGLWWPLIIWTTVLLGRAWCMVCPLEFVSSRAEKLSHFLGIQQASLSGWLAKGSLVILLFAFLQMLVPGVQIHRVPHYTSLFLWTSLILAFTIGLLYKNRAFCRGFCPVSLMLNAYGRGGMLAMRPAAGQDSQGGQAPNALACPSLLNPARLNTNKDCLLCGDCVKSEQRGAMQWIIRRPFARNDVREPKASWPLTLFIMAVSGFVTYELCGLWKAAEPVFFWVPRQMSAWLQAGSASGWIQGFWTIFLVPLLIWLVLGTVSLLCRAGKSLGDVWRRLALPLAMVVAAGHMTKGMEKFTSWIGFLPIAWAEPTGLQTAMKMNAKVMAQPSSWLTSSTLSSVGILLMILAIGLAVREARLADPEKYRNRLLPICMLGGFYGFLILGWRG